MIPPVFAMYSPCIRHDQRLIALQVGNRRIQTGLFQGAELGQISCIAMGFPTSFML